MLASGPDLLADLLAALLLEKPIPHEVRGWLLDGCLKSLRRGENIELGLGLVAPGRRSLQAQFMERLRDRHLCDALDHVAVDDGLIVWQRCVRLAPLIGAFLRVDWPQSKRLAEPPSQWPQFKRSLWQAAATGIELPRSAHALRATVLRNGGYSRNGPSHIIELQIRP